MIAAPSLAREDLYELALAFEDAQARLLAAQHDLFTLGDEVAVNKFALEDAKAKTLSDGVEGKNAEQREARMRLCLSDLYQTLFDSEQGLSQARLEFEGAKLEWDCLRYRLRAYEVASQLCKAA